jgi:hypothetical protein
VKMMRLRLKNDVTTINDDDKNVSFAIVFCIEKIYRLNIYIIITIKKKPAAFYLLFIASLHLDCTYLRRMLLGNCVSR